MDNFDAIVSSSNDWSTHEMASLVASAEDEDEKAQVHGLMSAAGGQAQICGVKSANGVAEESPHTAPAT